MTFTSLTLRVGSGFRFYRRNRLSQVRGIATFYSVLIIRFCFLEEVLEMQDRISLSLRLMMESGAIIYTFEANAQHADFATLESS